MLYLLCTLVRVPEVPLLSLGSLFDAKASLADIDSVIMSDHENHESTVNSSPVKYCGLMTLYSVYCQEHDFDPTLEI